MLRLATKEKAENGSTVTLTDDKEEGLKNANIVYVDVWVSMGEPEELWAKRIALLQPYQLTKEVMAMAKPDCVLMHALPSFHNTETTIAKDIEKKFGLKEMEVTDEVFESDRSIVFDEAENRMHTIKAVMYLTLSDGEEIKHELHS